LRLAYDDFLLSRQVMRCTAKTIDHYKYSAGSFVDWLEEQGLSSPDAIKAAHVRARLAAVGDTGVQDTTLHVHARGIKTFLRFLHAEGYIGAPITFAMPKLDKKRLPCASADELHRLLDACRHPRDKALLLLFSRCRGQHKQRRGKDRSQDAFHLRIPQIGLIS
jgi:site-specific recombinase XerD